MLLLLSILLPCAPSPPGFFFSFFFFTTWKSLTAVSQIPGHSQTTYMRFTRSTSSSLHRSTGLLVGRRTHGCTLNQRRIVTKPAPTCRILCPYLPLLPLLPLVECRIPAGKRPFKDSIQSASEHFPILLPCFISFLLVPTLVFVLLFVFSSVYLCLLRPCFHWIILVCFFFIWVELVTLYFLRIFFFHQTSPKLFMAACLFTGSAVTMQRVAGSIPTKGPFSVELSLCPRGFFSFLSKD